MSSSLDPSATDSISTSPYFTTALPSPTTGDSSSNNSNNGNNGITASSSLYLGKSPGRAACSYLSQEEGGCVTCFFTFLATLLLLLAVSCAIVIRSLILRRRFRRRVQEALANGIVLPPPPGGFAGAMGFGGAGRGRRDFGEKPTMWERWLAPPHELDFAALVNEKNGEWGAGRRWNDIMPVSAKIISDKHAGNGQPLPDASSGGRPSVLRSISGAGADLRSGSGQLVQRVRRWPFFHRSTSASTADSPSSNVADPTSLPSSSNPSNSDPDAPSAPEDVLPAYDAALLQLSVLIAMPSRFQPRSWDPQRSSSVKKSGQERAGVSDASSSTHEGEDDLPEVVFGVAEVPWKVSLAASSGTQNNHHGAERGHL